MLALTPISSRTSIISEGETALRHYFFPRVGADIVIGVRHPVRADAEDVDGAMLTRA